MYEKLITLHLHGGDEDTAIAGRKAVCPYVANNATSSKWTPEDEVCFYDNATHNAATTFFDELDEAFRSSFGATYDGALLPHKEGYAHVLESHAHCYRQILRNTPYIHTNVSFSNSTDGITQICVHTDGHTIHMEGPLFSVVPLAWIPWGPKPPNTMFGYPEMGRFCMHLDVMFPTLALMHDKEKHNSSSFDVNCDKDSTTYGIELGVSHKIFQNDNDDGNGHACQ